VYSVVLLDPTGESVPEVVFQSDDRRRLTRWVYRWLSDHLGLAPVPL
jgi:hypothetical protein